MDICMDEDIVLTLKNLIITTSSRRSKVGRIRELLPDIERVQQEGVRLIDISATLKDLGFEDMNLKCLQNLLYQARRKKGGKINQPITKYIVPPIQSVKKFPSTGIDAETILNEAHLSMKSKAASNITLGLLRFKKSTNEGNK